jgi:hypothetical protein
MRNQNIIRKSVLLDSERYDFPEYYGPRYGGGEITRRQEDGLKAQNIQKYSAIIARINSGKQIDECQFASFNPAIYNTEPEDQSLDYVNVAKYDSDEEEYRNVKVWVHITDRDLFVGLCKAMSKNDNVKSFKLYNALIKDFGFDVLANFLEDTKNLEQFEIGYVAISDKSFQSLADGLQYNKSLKRVVLNSVLTSPQTNRFFEALTVGTSPVQEVFVNELAIASSLSALDQLLCSEKQISKLVLHNCNIGNFSTFVEMVEKNGSLQELDIAGCIDVKSKPIETSLKLRLDQAIERNKKSFANSVAGEVLDEVIDLASADKKPLEESVTEASTVVAEVEENIVENTVAPKKPAGILKKSDQKSAKRVSFNPEIQQSTL